MKKEPEFLMSVCEVYFKGTDEVFICSNKSVAESYNFVNVDFITTNSVVVNSAERDLILNKKGFFD